jgi:hypothetical protein
MTQDFGMPQESVEVGLLSSVNQDLATWMELTDQIHIEDFTSVREIYVWMREYLAQYNQLPSNSLLVAQFQWHPPVGDFRHFFKEMKRYTKARQFMEAISTAYHNVAEPDDAINTLIQKLVEIQSHDNVHITAVDSNAVDRLTQFDWRTENLFMNNRMMGIPTSIQVINDSLMGWQGGDVICCFARPGVGKTWWLMDNCAIAWMAGYRTLCIEPENAISRLAPRIDCIIGNKLGYPLTIAGVTRGDPLQREAYSAVVQTMSQYERWWCYENFEGRGFNLENVEALIRRHEPQIVFVDGISLMQGEGRQQVWERMWSLSYGLKNIAMRHDIPIIFTTQAANTERGRRTHADETTQGARSDNFYMPSMNDVAYGDAVSQACSDLIAMCPEPSSNFINWLSIKKHRDRGFQNALAPRMGMAVDMSRGIMVDLSRLGFDPVAVGQATSSALGFQINQTLGRPS